MKIKPIVEAERHYEQKYIWSCCLMKDQAEFLPRKSIRVNFKKADCHFISNRILFKIIMKIARSEF
jgi:hypothetical protein